MIELPDLYPHQNQMLNEIRQALVRDQRSILCAPPGTGKTRLAKHILGLYANREKREGESGRALFVVHRRGLVDNASGSFSESPELPHGVIMSGRETDFKKQIQVASIDTMNSWYCDGGNYSGHTFDLIVYDECHSQISKLRSFLNPHDDRRAKENLKPSYVMGLSATPQHKELNQVFKSIVKGPSTSWLIANRYLNPYRYFQCSKGDATKLVKSGDEYTIGSVSDAMEGLAGNMVADWKRLATGRATVGFFPRRSHAFEAMEMFRAAGVNAVYLDGETPDDERLQMFSDLNEGRIDYIANVGVIERGTDIPRIGCIQMCVFVGSIVRWLQMIGRASRMHPDVEFAVVLDHGDSIRKHGFFEDDIDWSIEWGERPAKTHDAKATIECPSCNASYRGGTCRACGYEPTPKERKSQGLEFTGGTLREVQRKEKPERITKSNEALMITALYIASRRNQTFGQACVVARAMAQQQGTEFRVPARFDIGGQNYKSIPFGDPNSKRKVKDVYGVTVGNYSSSDNPYRER